MKPWGWLALVQGAVRIKTVLYNLSEKAREERSWQQPLSLSSGKKGSSFSSTDAWYMLW